ncbi:MAG TPA: sulfatase-like hydrolase/transferase [Chitinophagaceae bacterium]|nr:sulfatase-like hydrolase/transferase [Chitinophagaceae bacterium]
MKSNIQYSYLIFIPLYFVLDGNNNFWGEIPVLSSVAIFFIIIAVTLLSRTVLQKKINEEKTSIIIAWLLFHYLFFKIIKSYFTKLTHITLFEHYLYYLPLLVLVTIAFLVWVIKQKSLRLCNLFINIVFIVFSTVELIKLTLNCFTYRPSEISIQKLNFLNYDGNNNPNIYLLIMDEYVGSKTLYEDWQFDNSKFHNELRKRKFFVAKSPVSNYNRTTYSMLSMLNMGYINNVSENNINPSREFSACLKQIKQNQVQSFFKSKNYNIVNNSWLMDDATTNEKLFLPIKERLLLDKTFGSVLWQDLICNIPSNQIQKLIKTPLARIDSYNNNMIELTYKSINIQKSPTFFYTHLHMPHLPFLRNKEGILRNLVTVHNRVDQRANSNSYLSYFQYVNTTILKMVDSVLQKDDNPIVILASDHGFRDAVAGNKVFSEFNNFLAIYTPNQNYTGFNDSTCLVNVFRLLLTNHFGQKLPILKTQMINVNPLLKTYKLQ